MDFYNATESYESYEGIREHERQVIKNLTKSHPAFTAQKILSRVRKPEKFSSLSAVERWNYIKKIKDLQKLINEIQSDNNREIANTGFTLEEVLEVLNVRRAMHNDRDK